LEDRRPKYKQRYSGFFGTNLEGTLEGIECKKIVIAGINTHACIRMTVIDCIDSYDEPHHQISMRYMDGKIATGMTNSQLAAVFK